ncbi:acyl-CoA dehydrogenase family protein [Lysinibacillus pakistanensis]|uniref:Acyl-CoA dehydrogenase family protein n=1 Tax=Lysinibacillus pakistanensis TaxID=759811 RepID=A0AAX3WZZ7_9BACI|nr:acyl-CoA dehydrogenase family protein [Lysinibacillus pakistanensis]MDM5231676.1 acyl-CoA dehydrogenase family protein [Lysinibacillus pakistanensis]WHY47217.1 acyl-CoA dehydrogenase family protein [Lysinibacillus pakistanensis]WHY52226.1 acyl-CoA dehydrogenase family protein [Lysinibacillus pakistanensis]
MKVLQQEEMKTTNFFKDNDTLHSILEIMLDKEFAEYATRELTDFGELCAGDIDRRAKHTDREGEPRLERYNAYGEEISEIWVNDGYKKTIEETYNTGIVGYVHKNIPQLGRKGNYVYSFAQGYLLSHAEPGFYCPVTLTMATAYLLDHYANDEVKERFLPHVCATGDTELYEGATFLTERQGGSDVGANAVEARQEGEQFRLYGEKYFASNVGMCGVAMVLARLQGASAGSKGLTLFAVPWRAEDGTMNNLRIRRLKDKLGVKAVPSGEVEFDGALSYIVGEPNKGIYYMLEALNLSRICNAVASLGIMRRGFLEAKHYVTNRYAFGKPLTQYPMIQDTLGKFAAKLHVEVATVFDLIQLYDKVTSGQGNHEDMIMNRLNIAIMKKETAERAVKYASEAIELHGGNGYIEDFVTPRLLRDAQVLTVWEGTANILALELIRLVDKFQAHKLFVRIMEERLAKVANSTLSQLVVEQLVQLKSTLHTFSSLDEATKTLEAKAVAEKMAHMYESVVAVEWAHRVGGKYEKLADIYLEHTWALRELGAPMKTVQYFADIL